LNGNEKTNNYSTTIHLETQLKKYLLKEISSRKELSTRISLIIREMQFEFKSS
jgi:hypothetical protein